MNTASHHANVASSLAAIARDGNVSDEVRPSAGSYLAGRAGPRWVALGFGTQGYFVRAWALRAMLYAWDDCASATVIDALADEHWRPREMALKVVAKRLVDGDVDAVARLRDDPVPRVQTAAARALERLSRSPESTGTSGSVRSAGALETPQP
jgi:hypothetical protein